MSFYFPWFMGASLISVRNHLTAFLTLDPSAQAKITQAIKGMGYPFRRKEMQATANQLHQELKVLDADTLFNIIDSVTDFIPVPPTSLSNVLADIFKDTGSSYSNLESAIKEIVTDPKITEQRTVDEFTSSTLPYVMKMEHFCAMRARFDKGFSYRENDIESYNPKIVDYHPVAVFDFKLRGQQEDVTFQADQESLDRLISELIAAQRQLKLLVDAWAATREHHHGK